MQWQDEGFITRSLIFQESSYRLFIFTKHHGLATGLLRGGRRKTKRLECQRGNLLHIKWQARLEEHLGEWRGELLQPFGGYALSFPAKKLHAFESALALLTILLPERLPMQKLYHDSLNLLQHFMHRHQDYMSAYCIFEYQLLSHLGYGFNLDNANEVILLNQHRGEKKFNAEKYGEPFLPLPEFLLNHKTTASTKCQQQALQLSGYFLERLLLSLKKTGLPSARQQLFPVVGGG
ncbi:MAG: DNA repair protein RecO [Alphaproteobacteria bacterium]